MNIKELWMAWHNYVMSIPRKAWWLICWCSLHATIVLVYANWKVNTFKDVEDIRAMLEIPWIFFMSTPLWIKPLGDWVFRRGKYAEGTKEKK